ncbi:MAG: ribosome maturation factor RimM [Saprospiraceae bacterium]
MSDFIQIGFILKTHGVKGEIKVSIEDAYFEDYLANEIIFIQEKDQYNPLFVEQIRSDLLISKFEGYDTPEAAKRIASRAIFLRQSDLLPADKRTITVPISKYAATIGYEVYSEEGDLLGKITDIEEFPQQEMALLSRNERIVLLPLVDAFVREIDAKNNMLIVSIPEGLLDLE